MLLAPMSKGTGSAAADAQLARWSKLKNDALTSHLKNVKDPRVGRLSLVDEKQGALSLADDGKNVKDGADSKPAPKPIATATPAPIPTPTKSAYDVANEGGKHAGFLKTYREKASPEIQKGIDSIEEQIALHQDKIANPEKHIPEWQTLDPRQRKALVEKKWPSDVARQQEQADILRGLLKEKS